MKRFYKVSIYVLGFSLVMTILIEGGLYLSSEQFWMLFSAWVLGLSSIVYPSYLIFLCFENYFESKSKEPNKYALKRREARELRRKQELEELEIQRTELLNSCIQLLPSNYIDAEPYAQEYLNNLSNKEKVFLDELNTGKYSKKIIHETFNDLVIQSKAFFVNRMENYISNELSKNEGSRDIIKNELLISKISTATDLCTEIFSSLLKDKYLCDEEFDNTIYSADHFNINKTRKWEE